MIIQGVLCPGLKMTLDFHALSHSSCMVLLSFQGHPGCAKDGEVELLGLSFPIHCDSLLPYLVYYLSHLLHFLLIFLFSMILAYF